jgi:spore maturation protein CgeB
LETLFIATARRMPERRFVIGGALYPRDFPWTQNIYFVRHLPPPEHRKFYCSSLLTLNVTRAAMAETGFCPSGRLFEAAACGVPIITDEWAGLPAFFEPGREILVARSTEDVIAALEAPRDQLDQIAKAARVRCLKCHTAEQRVRELEGILETARNQRSQTPCELAPLGAASN